MPDEILNLAAEEYIEIAQLQQADMERSYPFYSFLKNWLQREGYKEYVELI